MRAPSVHSLACTNCPCPTAPPIGLVKEAKKSSHRMQPSAPLSQPRTFSFFPSRASGHAATRARAHAVRPCRISLHRAPLASQHYQLLFLFLVQPPVELHLSYLLLYGPYFSPTSFSPVGYRRRLARTAPCPPGSTPPLPALCHRCQEERSPVSLPLPLSFLPLAMVKSPPLCV